MSRPASARTLLDFGYQSVSTSSKRLFLFFWEIFCSKYKILLSLIEDLIEEIVSKNFLDRGMLCPGSLTALSQEGTDVQIQTQMTKTNTKG